MKILYTAFTFLFGCLLFLQNTSAQIYVMAGQHGIRLTVVEDNDINFDDPQVILRPFLNIANQEELPLEGVLGAKDQLGNTLLHMALRERADPEAIQAFIDSGAPLHLTNRLGVTPFEQAEQMFIEKLEEVQRQHEQRSFLARLLNRQINGWVQQWQYWFRRGRRYAYCPPGTEYSLVGPMETHPVVPQRFHFYENSMDVHCIPQQFQFYEEHVYALMIIVQQEQERMVVIRQ